MQAPTERAVSSLTRPRRQSTLLLAIIAAWTLSPPAIGPASADAHSDPPGSHALARTSVGPGESVARLAAASLSSGRPMTCAGYWSDLTAYWYLSIGKDDVGYCPVLGMLAAVAGSGGYKPAWGYNQNIADDHGLVAIKQSGECTGFPDTGVGYDFQIPCKAHDYCYDLRRASFSGTVSDRDCDRLFKTLLTSFCDDQPAHVQAICFFWADAAAGAVALPGVIAHPKPGQIELRNKRTGKCAEVERASGANNTPIQQWTCLGRANQRFEIWPAPGAPGFFQFRPLHVTGRCARAVRHPIQYRCRDWNSMRFRIQGALNHNQYSIRSRHHPGECWKVPGTWSNGADLKDPACKDTNAWYLWRIRAA